MEDNNKSLLLILAAVGLCLSLALFHAVLLTPDLSKQGIQLPSEDLKGQLATYNSEKGR